MKRLVVCNFFDNDGIVDEYVFHLLESFGNVAAEVVFLVNGDLINSAKKRISSMRNIRLLCRENSGFDSGAYKWFFLENPLNKNWSDYDEILIMKI